MSATDRLHPHPQSPLLSPDAAGAYIHVHRRTLANWRVLGRGPRYCRIGRQPLYRQADLDAWIEAHAFDHTTAERIGQHNHRPHGVEHPDRGAR